MEIQSGVLSPTESISEGWNIIKNNYGTYVLMMLVFGIILFIAAMIIGGVGGAINLAILSAIGYSPMSPDGAEAITKSFLPQALGLIVNFFTSIIITTISGAFVCGVYKALAQTARTGAAEFSDLFSGFDKILECLVAAIITSVIQIVLGMVMLGVTLTLGISAFGLRGLIGPDGKPNPEVFSGMLGAIIAFAVVSWIVQLLIYSLLIFIYPLIAERNLSGAQAVSYSAKGALGNFISVVLLMILLGLMMIGGFLLCVIGILFVAPILFASIFAAYRKIFGFSDGNYDYNPPPPPSFGDRQGF